MKDLYNTSHPRQNIDTCMFTEKSNSIYNSFFFTAVSRPMGPPVNLKILVPAIASGAIIGKGGETIADVQKQTGTRIKISKANDFYPGTTERVGLIQGPAESVLVVMDFIAEKIIEK